MGLGRRDTQEGLAVGKRARDKITGFEGVLVGEYTFLYGCKRWTLLGIDSTNRPVEHTVDEPQLELVSEKVEHQPRQATGGDRPTVLRPGPR